MPRIRTIKPEFPQSESLGRVSREARLCFVLLWTQADDAGRLRGASRMLASLLYPYDDDAPGLIDGWLDELGHEDCIRRYVVNGNSYIDIPKWLEHQKIDKPSPSRLPSFDEASRAFANVREGSATDLGPRTVDLGPGILSSADADDSPRPNGHGAIPAPKWPMAKKKEALDIWHEELGDVLRRVIKLTPTRASRLGGRLSDLGTLEAWRLYCRKIRNTPFLVGGGASGWRADFDWTISQANMAKVLEGNYDR